MFEKIEELRKYTKAMLIIDVDDLCLVSENESLSSMGKSASFSIQNQKMF